MIAAAIDKVLSLRPLKTFKFGFRTYTDGMLHSVKDPMLESETVSTLTGFMDLFEEKVNGFEKAKCFIHVESHCEVSVKQLDCTVWGERQGHIQAVLPKLGAFEFGRFMDQESFIIGLQAFFESTPDREQVLRTVSNLIGEAVSVSADDGIGQMATVRAGVVLKGEETVKRLVSLKPYRTFREIDQPASNFIFRLRSKQGEIPTCALFEADGGMWKLEAAQSIKAWIAAQEPKTKIIA